jgi:hypothetical protein
VAQGRGCRVLSPEGWPARATTCSRFRAPLGLNRTQLLPSRARVYPSVHFADLCDQKVRTKSLVSLMFPYVRNVEADGSSPFTSTRQGRCPHRIVLLVAPINRITEDRPWPSFQAPPTTIENVGWRSSCVEQRNDG